MSPGPEINEASAKNYSSARCPLTRNHFSVHGRFEKGEVVNVGASGTDVIALPFLRYVVDMSYLPLSVRHLTSIFARVRKGLFEEVMESVAVLATTF